MSKQAAEIAALEWARQKLKGLAEFTGAEVEIGGAQLDLNLPASIVSLESCTSVQVTGMTVIREEALINLDFLAATINKVASMKRAAEVAFCRTETQVEGAVSRGWTILSCERAGPTRMVPGSEAGRQIRRLRLPIRVRMM